MVAQQIDLEAFGQEGEAAVLQGAEAIVKDDADGVELSDNSADTEDDAASAVIETEDSYQKNLDATQLYLNEIGFR